MSSDLPVFISRKEAKSPFFVGVDLGGTNAKIGIVDDNGHTLSYVSMPTEVEKGPVDATRRMSDAILSAIRQAGLTHEEVVRVGLGSPGTMDIPAGKLVKPGNFPGWENFGIRDTLSEFCAIPVSFENDANAAAFGEYWTGSAKEFNSILLFTLGTGVGCGLVIAGRTLVGENSHGGECGHNIVDPSPHARMCNCGLRGHLEAYASATGVARRTFDLLEAHIPTSLLDRVNVETMTTLDKRKLPKMVYEEAKAGDQLSLEIIRETAWWLAIGTVTLLHTVDPQCVLLGGAMTFGGKGDPIGEMFLETFTDEIKKRTFPVLAERIVIKFAELGGHAGYLGAAGVARADYRIKGFANPLT
ncbi:MAG: ROK family protein [Planctomycetaceae bacterium]|jgi:glucokinase|nr:ROK family protein [Planctomycetaceae bacterium]